MFDRPARSGTSNPSADRHPDADARAYRDAYPGPAGSDPADYPGRQPYADPAGYPGRAAHPNQTVPYDRAPYPAEPRPPALRRSAAPDQRGAPDHRQQGGGPPAGPRGRQRPPGARRPDPRGTDPRSPGPASPRGDRQGRGFPLGAGALVGVVGLACFLLGLIVLPWFTAGGQEVTLADLRTAFTVAENPPDEPQSGPTDDVLSPDGGIPTPDELTDAAEQQVRDTAAAAAADAVDSGKARYLELYTERLWMGVAVAAAAAVVFSTILAPQSFALSLLLGFRRAAGAVTVLAGIAHGAALWVVFTGQAAPTPAWGVWLGVAGLCGVLLGCIVGPKG